MIYSNEEAGTMRAKIHFDFLSEEEKRRLCRNRGPELLDKSIMFSLFKLIFFFFSIASPFEKGKVITEPAVVSIRLLSVDSTLS